MGKHGIPGLCVYIQGEAQVTHFETVSLIRGSLAHSDIEFWYQSHAKYISNVTQLFVDGSFSKKSKI